MAISWRIRRYLSQVWHRLFPQSSPLTNTSNERARVAISIRQTEELTEENGRSPEQTVARYIAEALDKADHKYDIYYDYEPVSVDSQDAGCGDGSAFREWNDMKDEVPGIMKDSNLLLTNSEHGGCGFVGGNIATASGAFIEIYEPYRETGSSNLHRNIHGSLHEIGHNLGASHDHDDDRFGRQHPGMGWNEDGRWHRTPTVAGNGAPNMCGEEIVERRYPLDEAVRHQYYHECFVEEILSVE